MKYLEYGSVDSLAGESQAVQELKKISLVVCKNNACVLLKGERGSGKRLFARIVHLQGKNNPEDFFELNCRVYSAGEIEQFFSLVMQLPSLDFLGKTIFISGVENLSIELQEKLLVLVKTIREERRNIRFIFSTEVNIEDKIEQGLFLDDLYYTMSSVPVNVLPLRQRKEDIIPIAGYFFGKLKAQTGRNFEGFSEEAKEMMTSYFWPGNIAELKIAVERAFILGEPPFIKTADLALRTGNESGSEESARGILEAGQAAEDKTLKTAVNAFKKAYVTKILEENNWNQTKTAKILGIQRTYVIRLIDELQIRK